MYVVISCRCVYRCSVTLYIIGVSLTISWFYYDILYVYRLSWFFGDFVTTNCRCIDVYRDSVTIYRRDRDLVDGPVTGAGQCRGHGSLLVGYDRFWLWLLRQHLHYINIKLRKFCTCKSILTMQPKTSLDTWVAKENPLVFTRTPGIITTNWRETPVRRKRGIGWLAPSSLLLSWWSWFWFCW